MKRLSRHLPLVILAAILLCGVACGTDEPRGKDHGTQGGSTPVPHDTTRNNTNPPDTTSNDTTHNSTNPPDTTHNSTNDTTTTFSITLNVPRTIGYMGQTMQLNAVTTAPATVKWQSSRAAIATVDAEGLVTFCPTDADGTAVITATAGGVSDTVTLTNRCWHVAVWDGSAWSVPAYLSCHPGDTILLSITDSQTRVIDDGGFNAAACQWSLKSRNADVSSAVKVIATPAASNGWQYRLAVLPDAPTGSIIVVTAQHGDAASVLSCAINR